MAKYLITKVYLVEGESRAHALRMLQIATQEGKDWVLLEQAVSVETPRGRPEG
jgi:hypothetical protein